MRIIRLAAAFAGALVIAACGPDDMTGPGAVLDAAYGSNRAAAAQEGRIVVMTWNVFVGAAIENALDVSSPEEIPGEVADVWREIQDHDFPARARAIAREIDRYRPHLVGLQEINTFYLQLESDFDAATFNPGSPATTPLLDYEQEVMEALAERGLDYTVAVRSENFQVELPMLNPESPTYLSDIRLADHDLLLVRSDVTWADPQTAQFSYALDYLPILGIPLVTPRSWSYVDATVAGLPLRFAVTHLEPADIGPDKSVVPEVELLQRAQGAELRAVVAGERPVIAVGDFNSDAKDTPGTTSATYHDFLDAGWLDPYNQNGGSTCCQDGGIDTWPSELERRVDLILMHGDFGLDRPLNGAVQTKVVGNKRSDWRPAGLWPADHAGVVATIDLRAGG